MNDARLQVCLSAATILCLSVECRSGESAPAERQQAQEEWRTLDHQRAPLPDDPPIRLTRLSAFERSVGQSFSMLVFSPDGKTLAAARRRVRENPALAIWDVQTGKLLRVLRRNGHIDESIAALAFLPPGDQLVSGYLSYNKVLLWDVGTGKLLDKLDTSTWANDEVRGLASFPDGKRVICCATSGLIVWDLEARSHRALPLDEHVPVRDRTSPVPRHCNGVAFTADGSRFATTVSFPAFWPRILLWDAKTLRVCRVIPTGSQPNHLAYAPDGSSVAVVSFDAEVEHHTVNVWDAMSGRKLLAGRVYDHGVAGLTYTRDGKYLLAAGLQKHWQAGGNCEIGVWEVASGRLVSRLPVGYAMAVSPNNKLLAVAAGPNIEIYATQYRGQADAPTDAPESVKP